MRISMPKCKVYIFIPKSETRTHAGTEHEAQTRISLEKHETRVLQMRVSTPKREVRVLAPRRETRIQFVAEHDSRVPTTQRGVRVLKQTLSKREVQTRVSSQKCKIHVQFQMARAKADPKSPHPQGFEASPLDTPATDLGDDLTKKIVSIKSLSNTVVNGSSWQYSSNVTATIIRSSCRYLIGCQSP